MGDIEAILEMYADDAVVCSQPCGGMKAITGQERPVTGLIK